MPYFTKDEARQAYRSVLKHSYQFTFTLNSVTGRVTAVSYEQAVQRAKASYVVRMLGYPAGTAQFRLAVAQLRSTPVRLQLDRIAIQRFGELYREQYQLGIEDAPTQVEFAQLQDIVNKLKTNQG